MPEHFTGTIPERYDRLEARGLRCDANNRCCVHRAIERHRVVRADGFGNRVPGATPEYRQTCGRHRAQFKRSGFWIYQCTERIGAEPGNVA